MKKLSVLLFAICLLSFGVFAQTTDFSGTWELDKANSKLDERQSRSIESQTITVKQTATEITITTKTKRMPPPEGMMQGGGGRVEMPKDGAGMPPKDGMPSAPPNGGQGGGRGQGGGMMRGGMMGGMDGTTSYMLDKETSADQETPMGSVPVSLKSKFENGILKLSRSSSFSTPMGEMSISSNETWSLSSDGQTLTVKRESVSPRGTNSSESIYKKGTPATLMIKEVNGGVVNGKAISLPKPAYSEEAKAAGASGAVNVQVTIDEEGNVISAKAVSGNELLRPAAEAAAKGAKFSPTMLSGQPVKIKGVIVYNFAPATKQ